VILGTFKKIKRRLNSYMGDGDKSRNGESNETSGHHQRPTEVGNFLNWFCVIIHQPG
jgi:hypothetical protein